jgi:hypothetical protein
LGNLGNQGGRPIPPEPPDPNEWRHEQDGPRRWRPPELSTTQVLIGIAVFLAIVAVVTTQLIGSGNDQVSASIVSPDEGSSYSAGTIPIRLLSDLSGSWELFYSGPGTNGDWTALDRGVSPVDPKPGLHNLVVDKPGAYTLRFVLHPDVGEDVIDEVRFTVE